MKTLFTGLSLVFLLLASAAFGADGPAAGTQEYVIGVKGMT